MCVCVWGGGGGGGVVVLYTQGLFALTKIAIIE